MLRLDHSLHHLLALSLSVILVNRLVLSLRRAGNANDTIVQSVSPIAFAEAEFSYLGNIGAPLHLHDGDDTEDREDEGEEDDDDDELERQVWNDTHPEKG